MKKFTHSLVIIALVLLCASLCACNKNTTQAPTCSEGHTWELSSTTATCLDGGTEIYTCKICNETKTESVGAYGHSFVLVSRTDPTCKTTGEEVSKCSRCQFESKKTLLTIDCDYQVKSTTPSTCTEQGIVVYECSMCHTEKTEKLPIKEHNYVHQTTTPSSCLQFGKTIEKCSECGDVKTTYGNTLLAHHFDSTGFCSECGISKYYFNTDLNIKWDAVLGEITINLIPLFNNKNRNTADHWAAHTVYIKLTLYYSYEDEDPVEFQFDSQTDGKNCFWSLENEGTTTPLHFSARLLNATRYLNHYTISIECEGFESITQTYVYY